MELLSEWQLKNADMGWMQFAACRGVDPEVFFPDSAWHTGYAKAKEYCKECIVYKECLKFANDNGIEYGIWGGLSPNQRRRGKKFEING